MLSEWCVQENGKQNRPAVWLQFPRRILLLLIAFGLTLLILRGARDVIKLPPGSHEIDWSILPFGPKRCPLAGCITLLEKKNWSICSGICCCRS